MGTPFIDLAPVLRHPLLGTSSGYMTELRDDWHAIVAEALAVSPFAIELSALSERELPSLESFLREQPRLPFRFVSVHGPAKDRQLPDDKLIERLLQLPSNVDVVVLHPDLVQDPAPYRRLGSLLAIENMDHRKRSGRTADELQPIFDEVPAARFCFDVAHAAAIDTTMQTADELLDRFGARLSHVHVSSLDAEGGHVPLTPEDEERFASVLRRCRDVPWILEAALA